MVWWCSGLTCLPVTEEIVGSIPIQTAIKNTSSQLMRAFILYYLTNFSLIGSILESIKPKSISLYDHKAWPILYLLNIE